jgi:hypothetical protein
LSEGPIHFRCAASDSKWAAEIEDELEKNQHHIREPEMRRSAGIALLLLQMVSVAHARFVPSRWLAWAPGDYAVGYRLQVQIKGRSLSSDEVGARYQLPPEGVYENPAQNIIDIVRQRERTYGRNDQAEVVFVYRPNGGLPEEWRWPEK